MAGGWLGFVLACTEQRLKSLGTSLRLFFKRPRRIDVVVRRKKDMLIRTLDVSRRKNSRRL